MMKLSIRWSDGCRFIIEGRLRIRTIETGEEQEIVIGHFIDMDPTDSKIVRWVGAVGPLG